MAAIVDLIRDAVFALVLAWVGVAVEPRPEPKPEPSACSMGGAAPVCKSQAAFAVEACPDLK